jgi:nitrate reductase gamma subunit
MLQVAGAAVSAVAAVPAVPAAGIATVLGIPLLALRRRHRR